MYRDNKSINTKLSTEKVENIFKVDKKVSSKKYNII